MWSFEWITTRKALLAAGLAVATAAGGCQVRPLYGPTTVAGQSMAMALAEVDVAPIEGRVGQAVRNDLLFLMNGGDPGNGTYVVDLKLRQKYASVITRSITGLPGARNIRLVVGYSLTRQDAPDEVLSAGSVERVSSYDFFNQRFANDRAAIDAEDRIAREVAADIHLRLASYFATGKIDTDETPPPDLGEDDITNFGNAVFDEREPTYGAPDIP